MNTNDTLNANETSHGHSPAGDVSSTQSESGFVDQAETEQGVDKKPETEGQADTSSSQPETSHLDTNSEPAEETVGSTAEDASTQSQSEEDISIDALKQQIEELNQTIANQKNDVLKAFAELENFKKRNQQEVANYKKFALEKFVLELLPIQDGFERASQLKDEESSKLEDIIEGYSMIQKQMTGLFEKFQVSRIDAKDKAFDPNLHQAISQVEQEGVEPNIIVNEAQAGYTLNERVIRPSLVVVSK